MAHWYRLGLVIRRYQVRVLIDRDIYHRGCAYAVLKTVRRPGVYSAAYGTVHYKEPLKSFKIRVGIVPAWGFLLARYCHACAESDVKQYSPPNKHETLTHCWYNAGLHSTMLAQHHTDTGSMFCVYWELPPLYHR